MMEREINENVTCTLQKEEFDEKKAREILMSLPSDDPVDLFQLFFDDGLFEIIREESLRYAMQKTSTISP